MNNTQYTTVDEYIAAYPDIRGEIMTRLRNVIRAAAPEATEKISWGMPTFHQKHNIIHFAAHKNHIGIYPGAQAMESFAERLKDYKTSKGALQLPLEKPIPYELVAELVKFNLASI